MLGLAIFLAKLDYILDTIAKKYANHLWLIRAIINEIEGNAEAVTQTLGSSKYQQMEVPILKNIGPPAAEHQAHEEEEEEDLHEVSADEEGGSEKQKVEFAVLGGLDANEMGLQLKEPEHDVGRSLEVRSAAVASPYLTKYSWKNSKHAGEGSWSASTGASQPIMNSK